MQTRLTNGSNKLCIRDLMLQIHTRDIEEKTLSIFIIACYAAKVNGFTSLLCLGA